MVSYQEAKRTMKETNKNRTHSPESIERLCQLTELFMKRLAKEVEKEMPKEVGRGSRVQRLHVEAAFGRIMSGEENE